MKSRNQELMTLYHLALSWILCKDPARTVQETPFTSVIKTSQLMPNGVITAVCSEINTEHINTLCGQNVVLLNVKLVVHIVTTGLDIFHSVH